MIVIRPCTGFDELQACVDLQVDVWGYCEGDVIPRRVFLVAKKIGGQVIGAFETPETSGSADGNSLSESLSGSSADSLVGFALSLPGVKTGPNSRDGRPVGYLHSHMLAVKDGYRDQRIGARLKLAQRDDALARGIDRIEWTFDPLEIKNSFLNIRKLGAIVRSYEPDFYGVSSSRLQGGLPTDRLVAEWWLSSPRVIASVSGLPAPEPVSNHPIVEEIRVPAAIYQWKAEDRHRDKALAVQVENRHRFQQAFAQGLAVVGFTRDAEGNGVFHLGQWTEPEPSPTEYP